VAGNFTVWGICRANARELASNEGLAVRRTPPDSSSRTIPFRDTIKTKPSRFQAARLSHPQLDFLRKQAQLLFILEPSFGISRSIDLPSFHTMLI
jgi:hypothetical protein